MNSEIGSDMELIATNFLLKTAASPPWEDGSKIAYVETGRQALQLISDLLWDSGQRTLLLPSFLCESMLSPFQGRDWDFQFVEMNPDLTLSLDSLRAIAAAVDGNFVALVALYFGRVPDSEFVQAILELQSLGGVVIDDETHRVLSPGRSRADISIASLRKTLPVGDGAYLRGKIGDLASRVFPARQNGRWEAMRAKSDSMVGGDSAASKAFFRDANSVLDASRTAHAPDMRTLESLRTFDYEQLAQARVRNAAVLARILDGEKSIRIVNKPTPGSVPSHLVVEVHDPQLMQESMAASGVFCPIHWPRPSMLEPEIPWQSNILSIPIDHRYTPEQMTDVGRALLSVTKS
ncbi:hypothetical protein ESZ53_08930 [Salinibacterium sp. UTAS2018]|uniref:hypothetical protein n=1 Tax=Salinibacterium sp. UTAS2018 TaxID=2508880 RepID=UPI00100975A2|nr:hypothetical protein [Salinibacterium sp. UTAS2018]QAV70551.1 hypothetical protein ESZ53_08930 [Salinibacterium sp. UTAS2018]